jgi:hypothetical protein
MANTSSGPPYKPSLKPSTAHRSHVAAMTTSRSTPKICGVTCFRQFDSWACAFVQESVINNLARGLQHKLRNQTQHRWFALQHLEGATTASA